MNIERSAIVEHIHDAHSSDFSMGMRFDVIKTCSGPKLTYIHEAVAIANHPDCINRKQEMPRSFIIKNLCD